MAVTAIKSQVDITGAAKVMPISANMVLLLVSELPQYT